MHGTKGIVHSSLTQCPVFLQKKKKCAIKTPKHQSKSTFHKVWRANGVYNNARNTDGSSNTLIIDQNKQKNTKREINKSVVLNANLNRPNVESCVLFFNEIPIK